ncbi:MAG: hypothetical protein ACK5KT_06945 [Dysgonomonas sp.]
MQESFKNRVSRFWEAFSDEEPQIREMMDNKVEDEIILRFVNSILLIVFGKVYFEIGINDKGKYELILTPEGNRIKLMQLYYWLQYAPKHLKARWNFYPAKPPLTKSGSSIMMFGIKLDEEDISIYTKIDNERNKLDIDVYSTKLMTLNENQRHSIFFIYIDQFIGELYTMEYIGYVDFVQKKKNNDTPIKISELKSFIDNTIKNNNWPEFENPYEIYNGYRMEPNKEENWKLREDIFSGYTSCSPILDAYYNEDNQYFEEAKSEGVRFGFIFFENINIPRENIVTFRGKIEDKIVNKTMPYGIANSLGGATGFHFSYIDFIIYDYTAFLKNIKEILSSYKFEEVGYSDFSTGAPPRIL